MKIFIGCSSSEKINKKYLEEASNLGQELANIDGMELLFGYSDEGSMGRLYKAFINNEKKVSGYNTPIYNTNLKCHNTIICDTIIDRTKALLQSADIWLFLPGGIGTHQELFDHCVVYREIAESQLSEADIAKLKAQGKEVM